MAEEQNGGMVEWWNGGTEERRNGGMAEWQNGGMAERQNGRMSEPAERQNGKTAERHNRSATYQIYLIYLRYTPTTPTLIFYSIQADRAFGTDSCHEVFLCLFYSGIVSCVHSLLIVLCWVAWNCCEASPAFKHLVKVSNS